MLASYISPLRARNVRRTTRGQCGRSIPRNAPVTLLWIIGNVVPPTVIHRAGVDEVLVQVVSKLKNVYFHRARHHDVVDQASWCQPTQLPTGHRTGRGTNLKWMTCSHKPTPPEWGHTGTPNFAAINKTARTSLTPARRTESIWQTSMASAWKSCLKTILLCACSPVATPIPCGLRAFRMVA